MAPLYTAEDLKAAEKTITEEGFGKMTVKVVYESEFYIPQQDAQMA